MRILHLLASPVFSGPAENVALLALAQRALGHEVAVAVDRKRPHLAAEEPAVPRLRGLGLLDEEGLELSVKSSPWAMARDVRRLSRRRVDVVHAHFSHDHLLARFGRPRGAALVRSIHAPRSLRRTLPRADGFTVPSERELRALLGRPVLVLPALVDAHFRPPEDRAALRARLGVTGGPLVGMVSTFQASRRHDVGVDAFALLCRARPEARMVLVGDGMEQPAIRERVARLGLSDAVHFAGYQQGEAFVSWLQALDEVWVLGLGNDWTGRVAAQARACGVRVVAVQAGALARSADTLLDTLTPEAVCAASLVGERRTLTAPSNEETARQVLALYAQAGARAP